MNNEIFLITIIILLTLGYAEYDSSMSEEDAQAACQAKQKVAIYANGDWYCVQGEKL